MPSREVENNLEPGSDASERTSSVCPSSSAESRYCDGSDELVSAGTIPVELRQER